jgi:DnaJ-domain-containing protein 1
MIASRMQRLFFTSVLLLGRNPSDAFVHPSSACANTCISSFPYGRDLTFQRTSAVLRYQRESGTSEKDFYSVLGITKSAAEAEIKGAYRKLAKLYHPGKARNFFNATRQISPCLTLQN